MCPLLSTVRNVFSVSWYPHDRHGGGDTGCIAERNKEEAILVWVDLVTKGQQISAPILC